MKKSIYKSGDKIILTKDTQGLKEGTELIINSHWSYDEYNCTYFKNNEKKYHNLSKMNLELKHQMITKKEVQIYLNFFNL